MLTEAELRALLLRVEGQHIEFKSLWDQDPPDPKTRDRRDVRDEIAEHVAAFANADGGILLLGVEDDGTPTGHAYHDEAIDDPGCAASRRPRTRCPLPARRHPAVRLAGMTELNPEMYAHSDNKILQDASDKLVTPSPRRAFSRAIPPRIRRR